MFQTVPLSIIMSFFTVHTAMVLCHTSLLTVCEQDQDGTAVPSWSCYQAVWHIPMLCVQWKTHYDGQRNCLKHTGFYSKNKFEKLVHLFGFIIRIYHDARSPEHQPHTHTHCIIHHSTLYINFSFRYFIIIHILSYILLYYYSTVNFNQK